MGRASFACFLEDRFVAQHVQCGCVQSSGTAFAQRRACSISDKGLGTFYQYGLFSEPKLEMLLVVTLGSVAWSAVQNNGIILFGYSFLVLFLGYFSLAFYL